MNDQISTLAHIAESHPLVETNPNGQYTTAVCLDQAIHSASMIYMSEHRRSLSCWPLLGHWSGYPKTLREILKTYQDRETNEDALEALVENGLAKSRTSAMKLRNYLSGMGLLEKTSNGKFTPSEIGQHYLLTNADEPVQKALRDNLSAISEIEQLLTKNQMTISKLAEAMDDEYDISWKSDWQIRFRLNWMRAFGMVERLNEKQSIGRYPEWRTNSNEIH